jgi:nucleolin
LDIKQAKGPKVIEPKNQAETKQIIKSQ